MEDHKSASLLLPLVVVSAAGGAEAAQAPVDAAPAMVAGGLVLSRL